jgi:hypothetical protein
MPSVTQPPAQFGLAMAFDSARRRAVLFGGIGGSLLDETWEWDGRNWRRLVVSAPAARFTHAMAFDSGRNRTVLFGGFSSTSNAFFNDTWDWDGATWTQLSPFTRPPVRRHHALAYDSARRRIVLFGGFSTVQNYGDTWEFDGNNWTQRFPAAAPAARWGHAMAFDVARGRVVLFGGVAAASFADTWEWDGSNWIQRTPATSPSARNQFAMAYDPTRGKTVLFGSGVAPMDETWEWDGNNWSRRTPLVSPPGRYYDALAHDDVRGVTVLFGGLDPMGGPRPTTWELNAYCDAVGAGQASNSPSLQCTSVPFVGGQLCVTFPSQVGVGVLLLSAGACQRPPIPITFPFLCQLVNLYPNPATMLAVAVAGNPANLCLPIPANTALAHGALCLQALAQGATACLNASEGIAVRILE